jgi:hypothetical protein
VVVHVEQESVRVVLDDRTELALELEELRLRPADAIPANHALNPLATVITPGLRSARRE